LILTVPVLSPTAAGSIIRLEGPVIVAVFPVPLATDIPIPVDVNLLVIFNVVAVIAPDTFTSSNSVCPSTSSFAVGIVEPIPTLDVVLIPAAVVSHTPRVPDETGATSIPYLGCSC
jgi:hypothetical protein